MAAVVAVAMSLWDIDFETKILAERGNSAVFAPLRDETKK
jgi:hypothetical protein